MPNFYTDENDMFKVPKDQPIAILSIGTKILMKDVMDQYLRSLGEIKTYYASKMGSALESYKEKRPNIIFCEQSFPEGSALEFIRGIGGLEFSADRYFVLAAEQAPDQLVALAAETNIDEILVKPFSTDSVHQVVERYFEKRTSSAEQDWIKELRTARQSFTEKRFMEADELFARAARTHKDNVNVLLECAGYFLDRNNPEQAEKYITSVLETSPENVRALHLSGMVDKRLCRYLESQKKFLRADQISPLNTIRHLEMADLHLLMAEELVQNSLKYENDNAALILRKAKYQLMRGDYAGVAVYLDAKRMFLGEAGKKEGENLIVLAKKFGGLK